MENEKFLFLMRKIKGFITMKNTLKTAQKWLKTGVFLLTILSTVTFAEEKKDPAAEKKAAAEKAELVKYIENYLNSLKSIEAQFTQSDPKHGGMLQGSVYLKRPYGVRIQYDLPNGNIFVGNQGELRYYDKKMDKVNSSDLNTTPLGLLLREKIDFEKDIKVIDAKRNYQTIRLLLSQEGSSTGGMLLLVFSDNPLSLKQWITIDSSGNKMQFSLVNANYNSTVNERYFELSQIKRRF